MTALVFVPSSSPVVALIGLAVTIAAAVLVAHWGAYRPQVKRLVTASLIAIGLASVGDVVLPAPASVGVVVVRAEEEEEGGDSAGGDPGLVIENPCVRHAHGCAYWYLYGCFLP